MIEIDWSEHAGRLRSAAVNEADWNEMVAGSLVRATDRIAVDVGCGGGGMAKALAAALAGISAEASAGVLPGGVEVVAIDADPEVLREAREHTGGAVRCELASMDDGAEPLRRAIGAPASLIWASASVHHAGDQQAAVDALASLLAPGGRLALAEGGLPSRSLPWDLGIGEPGLELRLDAAQDRFFAAMRAGLPGSVPMPYGWTDALRRAGLVDVTTRTVLTEKPAPLSDEDLDQLIDQFRHRIEWLDPAASTGQGQGSAEHGLGSAGHGHESAEHGHESAGHGHGHGHGDFPPELGLSADDLAVWRRLLDPADSQYLGRRTDLAVLSARSIHVGHAAG